MRTMRRREEALVNIPQKNHKNLMNKTKRQKEAATKGAWPRRHIPVLATQNARNNPGGEASRAAGSWDAGSVFASTRLVPGRNSKSIPIKQDINAAHGHVRARTPLIKQERRSSPTERRGDVVQRPRPIRNISGRFLHTQLARRRRHV